MQMHKPTTHEMRVAERYESMALRHHDRRSIDLWGEVRGWLYVARTRGQVRRSLRKSIELRRKYWQAIAI